MRYRICWVCRFILFYGNPDPAEVGAERIRAFLEDLGVRGHVSASTLSQASNALAFGRARQASHIP